MKSNPRGDTQIVSGLSVSLSTLSAGIFSRVQPLFSPPGAAFVVSITHFLDAYLRTPSSNRPRGSLTTLGDKSSSARPSQDFKGGGGGPDVTLARGLDTFLRQDKPRLHASVDESSGDRRESFLQIYGPVLASFRDNQGWFRPLMRDLLISGP